MKINLRIWIIFFLSLFNFNNGIIYSQTEGVIEIWGFRDTVNYYCCTRFLPDPNEYFISIAAGRLHSMGLKNDGTIATWGCNCDEFGFPKFQCNVPSPNTDFIAIAANNYYSMGLKNNGMIIVWGDTSYGISNLPVPNEDFIDI